MGTQVAVKELVSLQDKAKDEVCRRKGRTAKQAEKSRRTRQQQQAQLQTHQEEEEQSSDSSDTDRCAASAVLRVSAPTLTCMTGSVCTEDLCARAGLQSGAV